MKMFVGLTDFDWFEYLKERQCKEVNFWKPSEQRFTALAPNDLFLFKLHHPQNYIVGGGFFVKYSLLPTNLAWDAFGVENGRGSLSELNKAILNYRRLDTMPREQLQIGCIILTDVFYFTETDWIPAPDNFSKNIVSGKSYSPDSLEGAALYQQINERLQIRRVLAYGERYREGMTKHRLGQGAFRIAVTDAYHRRCAISGEKTLPVLQAAHIIPFSQGGQHSVDNGILLRSDIHTLYDQGYITIDPQLRVDVSSRLHEDFGNGRDYYKFHGAKLMVTPELLQDMPSREALAWHNEHVCVG